MAIWAIADLHLSFGVTDKSMDLFGPAWQDHAHKIQTHWHEHIDAKDLVLIAGDISWAMKTEEAILDLQWIDALPGKKIIIKGNHDFWWPSYTKLKKILPPSIEAVHHNVITINSVAIGGARLWDSAEYQFNEYIQWQGPAPTLSDHTPEEREKRWKKEQLRLEMSLCKLPIEASIKIAMTHYPPIGADLRTSSTHQILKKMGVDICVFGHLHNVPPTTLPFGVKDHIHYHLTSCDYLNFIPKRIVP